MCVCVCSCHMCVVYVVKKVTSLWFVGSIKHAQATIVYRPVGRKQLVETVQCKSRIVNITNVC